MLQTAIPERLYSKLVADLLQSLARADTGALQRLLQATSPDSDGIEGENRGGVNLLAALDNFLQAKRTSAHRRKHHTLPNEDEETAEVVGMFDRLTSEDEEDRTHSAEDRKKTKRSTTGGRSGWWRCCYRGTGRGKPPGRRRRRWSG
ncbi:Hypp1848 [Branchiostoma lanceolatum]|uniref:Hypp1848 protein n=1 Tax=Branchiostoma lanceolatum TaxID=7740 RepID=A0A8K0EKH8_BRALA|nr:Hypp1848 [Branchiostoma lanceolatum]